MAPSGNSSNALCCRSEAYFRHKFAPVDLLNIEDFSVRLNDLLAHGFEQGAPEGADEPRELTGQTT